MDGTGETRAWPPGTASAGQVVPRLPALPVQLKVSLDLGLQCWLDVRVGPAGRGMTPGGGKWEKCKKISGNRNRWGIKMHVSHLSKASRLGPVFELNLQTFGELCHGYEHPIVQNTAGLSSEILMLLLCLTFM